MQPNLSQIVSIFTCFQKKYQKHMLSLQVVCYILAIMDKSQFLRAERVFFFVVSSGGSRIFPGGGGANSQKCYYFSIFCRKLHENERIWTPGGARVPGAPPLDPPMVRLNFQYCQHRHQISSVIQSPLLQELELLKENVHVYRKVTDWFTMSSVEITCLGQRIHNNVTGSNTSLPRGFRSSFWR